MVKAVPRLYCLAIELPFMAMWLSVGLATQRTQVRTQECEVLRTHITPCLVASVRLLMRYILADSEYGLNPNPNSPLP